MHTQSSTINLLSFSVIPREPELRQEEGDLHQRVIRKGENSVRWAWTVRHKVQFMLKIIHFVLSAKVDHFKGILKESLLNMT